MKNILNGRLYLENEEMVQIIDKKIISILGFDFLCDNFRIVKKDYYINNGKKITNILYNYDIHNNTNIENYIVKYEVEDSMERYVKKCKTFKKIEL